MTREKSLSAHEALSRMYYFRQGRKNLKLFENGVLRHFLAPVYFRDAITHFFHNIGSPFKAIHGKSHLNIIIFEFLRNQYIQFKKKHIKKQ